MSDKNPDWAQVFHKKPWLSLIPIVGLLGWLFWSSASDGNTAATAATGVREIISYLVGTFSFFAGAGGVVALACIVTMKHGFGDKRKKKREDVFGAIATKDEEPTLLERMIDLLSIKSVRDRFQHFCRSQIDVATNEEFGRKMMRLKDRHFRNSENPLLRGDLLAEAKRRWEHALVIDEKGKIVQNSGHWDEFIEIPPGMDSDIRYHGKLDTGEPLAFLTGRLIRPDHVEKAYAFSMVRCSESASYVPLPAFGLGIGVAWFVGKFVATHVAAQLGAGVASTVLGILVGLISGSGIGFAAGAAALLYLAKMGLHARSVAAFLQHVVNSDETLVSQANADIPRAKDELKRAGEWSDSYRKALEVAYNDKTATVILGKATGHGLLHGASPYKTSREGQYVAASWHDLSMGGMIYVGGTGSGKSYAGLLPLLAQLMNSVPNGITQALVSFDMKAVLHNDITRLAKKYGWKFRNIGVGAGEWGIDMCDGISPLMFSLMLTESAEQQGKSGGNDKFWNGMAATIRYYSAIIAQVYELTDAGLEEVRRSGARIYSPQGIYRIARSSQENEGYLFKVVDAIYAAFNDPKQLPYISKYCTSSLFAAIDFMRVSMRTLFSESTIGGFMATLASTMEPFIADDMVCERFGSASGNIIDVERLWDNKTVTNFVLSPYEQGDFGRIIGIVFKVRMYHWAAMRQLRDPDIGKKQKLMVVIDECQEFVTSGSTFSEANFLNTSRAMGISFALATQTIEALEMRMGSMTNVANMLAQLRAARIFLSNENPATVNYLKSVVPETKQSDSMSEHSHESILTWRKEKFGSIAEEVIAPDYTDEEIMAQCHPLVHGRVEPLIRKRGVKYSETAYEDMFVGGEDWIQENSPQGIFTSLLSKFAGGVKNNDVGGVSAASSVEPVSLKPVFRDLAFPIGMAVVISNRGSMMRYEKVELMTEDDFPPRAPEGNDPEGIDLQKLDAPVEGDSPHSINAVERVRLSNANETAELV